ncbi:cyclic lactone autoinducer peptide [uncultured Ruminococcus sp.]|nr:cyclic lactone autoinducer peptide [uncultured Ruminococcus sp.]
MTSLVKRYSATIAALALGLTTMVANSACCFCIHQPKMPETAKKLRKF